MTRMKLEQIIPVSFALLAFLMSSMVIGQDDQTWVIGEQRSLESKKLGETRQLIIGKPASYGQGNQKYPVVVLLDGDAHFHHTTGTANFLAMNGFMPEALVVAIPNTDRTRDLTPKTDNVRDRAEMPTAGGADDFLAFIKDELLPWVSSEYRTNDYRILIGHSFGGLFAIHALTTQPDVFDAYIAISPSLQWNDQGLVAQTEAFVEKNKNLDIDLYITAGNEGGALTGGIQKVTGVFTEKAGPGLRWKFDLMEEQTHGSVPLRSTVFGFETIFADWRLNDPLYTYNAGGMEAIAKFYEKTGKRYGVDRGIAPQTLFELSHALMHENRPAEAGKVMTYDSDVFPAPAGMLNQVAKALVDNGDKKQAIDYYTLALQENPSNKAAREGLTGLGKDPNKMIKAVKVDEKTLAKYAGQYEIPQVAIIDLTLKDGKLVRTMEGLPSTEMLPLSKTKFYRVSDDVQYIFNIDNEGGVESVTIRQGGQVFLANKVNR